MTHSLSVKGSKRNSSLAEVYTSTDSVQFAGNVNTLLGDAVASWMWASLLVLQILAGFVSILIGIYIHISSAVLHIIYL
jgi:hypothetical protein